MIKIQKKTIKKISISVAALALLVFTFVFILFLLVATEAFGPLQSKTELKLIKNEQASLVYSSDSVLIGKYFAENRTNVQWEEVPDHLVNALVATEDKRFFSHDGFDIRSYIRVLFRSLLLGDKSGGGGSTLTQQIIKNLFGRGHHGALTLPVNKIKEAILASRLEKVYNKQELLLLYLNSVPFGEDVFGIESASHRYFNKSVSQLRAEESAVLVGLLKANTYFNPRLNPENSIRRRNVVIGLMANEKYLSKAEADSLRNLPLLLNYENLNRRSPAGYFVFQVKKQANEILQDIKKSDGTAYDIEKDGLKIETTLDSRIQLFAQEGLKKHLKSMQVLLDDELKAKGSKKRWLKQAIKDSLIHGASQKEHELEVVDWDGVKTVNMSTADSLWYYEKMLNGAVLAANPENGAILCWIGGNNYRYLPFDMVLSHRQIASAIKPILYASAFEHGFDPCTYLKNEQVKYPEYNDWEPKNFDLSSTPDSLVAAWYALSHSMNIPTVDMYFKTGWENLVTTVNKFGLPPLTTEYPSVSLGALDVSLYEIIRAYSVFAQRGQFKDLYAIEKIRNTDGEIIYQHPETELKEVMDSIVCDQITAILRQAINSGTGTKIRNQFGVKSDLAGKTGTAQDYTNSWFLAYTPNLVIGTWVGARTPQIHFGSAYGTGSSLALPIVGNVLSKIENDTNLASNYLTPFSQFADSSDMYLHCWAYKPIMDKNILQKIFKLKNDTSDDNLKLEKGKQTEPDEKEKGVKGFFKRLFKKK